MLRNSFKYVNYSDLKKFSSDFKAVYNAPNETAAWSELEAVKEKWGKKYPYAISNWENNWEDVSSFFQFSDDIRRIMYTTYTDKKTIPTFPEIPATTGDFRKNIGIVFYRRYKASAIFSSFQFFPVFSSSGFIRSIALASVSSVTKA